MKEEMKIGMKGQVVIPKHFREVLGVVPGTKVFLELKEKEKILILEKPEQKTEEIFAKIANSGKVKKINLDREYEKRMEERWRKHFI